MDPAFLLAAVLAWFCGIFWAFTFAEWLNGRPATSVLLAVSLGPLGLLIGMLLPPTPDCAARRQLETAAALRRLERQRAQAAASRQS